MITIRGSINFIMEQHKRFPRHSITRLVRKDGDWMLSLKHKGVEE